MIVPEGIDFELVNNLVIPHFPSPVVTRFK